MGFCKIFFIYICLFLFSNSLYAKKALLLLHGLGRTATSMNKIEKYFTNNYDVYNLDYPSRRYSIEILADNFLLERIKQIELRYNTIDVVTHSMGGIILRYIEKNNLVDFRRVVMLSPPSKGSEIADYLSTKSWANYLMGPALHQLRTDSLSFVSKLGIPKFEFAIITGDRSMNPINSYLIKGKDDGKVSVFRSRLVGMKDFRVVHCTHTFIMKRIGVITMIDSFFEKGHF